MSKVLLIDDDVHLGPPLTQYFQRFGLGLEQALTSAKANAEAATALKEAGVNLWDWSPEDRAAFRAAAIETWPEFATTPEAMELVESHTAYLKSIGIIPE